MDVTGVTWTFHAGVYPRYSYFRDRLTRLYPRFQQIIEKEQLEDTICRGKEWLQEIQANTYYLNETPSITVLYDPSVNKKYLQGLTLKHFIVNSNKLKYKKPEIISAKPEAADITKTLSRSEPSRTISANSEAAGISRTWERSNPLRVTGILEKPEAADITRTWKRSEPSGTILAKPEIAGNSRTWERPKPSSITWAEIIKNGQTITQFHPQVIVLCVGNDNESYDSDVQALSEIQKQNLIIFNVGTKQCERFLKGSFISKELNVQDLTTANEILPLAKLIQEVLEAKPVGVIEDIAAYCRRFELNDVQAQSRSLIDEVNHELSRYLYDRYVWRELGGAEEQNSQQHSTEKSGQEYMDVSETRETYQFMPPTKKIKLMNENEKSFERYTKALSRMTKCLICGYLSVLYGLPQYLIAAFLSESGFDFESKCIKHMKSSSLKHWNDFDPTKKSPKQKSKFFREIIVSSFQELLTETQEFVKVKLKAVNILNELQFEIRALLRQTNIKLQVLGEKDLAPSPRLPLELQKELLLLEKVEGSGTIFGKLTLHTVEQLTDKEKNKVDKLLEIHRYRHGYSIELIEPKEENMRLEQGSRLKGNTICEGEGIIGSLGCFINVKNNQDDTKTLHAVTNAHNFSDCSPQIKAEVNENDEIRFDQFGEADPTLACVDGEMVDIQAIKVDQIMKDMCDTSIKSPYKLKNSVASPLCLYEDSDELAGKEVYKIGAITGLTYGIVASSDFRKKVMAVRCDFNDVYNIFVRAKTGQRFSKPGDSGSIVCRQMPDGSIELVSMLKSAIRKKDKPDILFYNTCHLKRSLERIADENRSIELATSADDEEFDDIADLLVFS